MLFESKRLLELAGIKSETEGLLTEGASQELDEFSNNDGVTEREEDESCSEEDSLRETVRLEIERMWASGEVFGKKSSNKDGVTMGFLGAGFKR